jgi:hypothetical protein
MSKANFDWKSMIETAERAVPGALIIQFNDQLNVIEPQKAGYGELLAAAEYATTAGTLEKLRRNCFQGKCQCGPVCNYPGRKDICWSLNAGGVARQPANRAMPA